MVNIKGNVGSLRPYENKWRSGKTQTIRVPVVLAQQILAIAHNIDASESLVTENELVNDLRALKLKIDAKEVGYRPNSASKLISALKIIFEKV